MKPNDVRQSSHAVYGAADQAEGTPREAQQDVAMAPQRRTRNAAAPPRGGSSSQPVGGADRSAGAGDGVTRIRLQGIGIKTDYTVKEVLTITADAFQKPFTAFLEYMGNAGSLLVDGRPATQKEKESIRKVTEKFDALAGAAAPASGNMQMVGTLLHRINDAANGKMPGRDAMASDLMNGVTMADVVIPGFKRMPPRPGGPPPHVDGANPADVQNKPSSQADAMSGRVQQQLAQQGPLNLTPSLNRAADEKSVDAFSSPVTFYRKDQNVPNMDFPAALHASEYKDRLGVVTFGKGKDLTSYNPGMKAFLNADSPDAIGPELANANVIDLGSGKNGTAAIEINFADLDKGSTTIVTGGHMRGSTMLFTADNRTFCAYHAQMSKKTSAKAADAAASSIASVHDRFGVSGTLPSTSKEPENGFDALFRAATRHPFSAVVYSYDDPSNNQPHPKYGPSADVGVSADGNPWSMMNFNYLAPDRNSREVGTATAVITKDMDGKVTVRVLAERGKLENKNPDRTGKPPRNFSYRKIEGAVGTYSVPGDSIF
ncbi:MAG TPA: cytotoxic necrotizing factor Rho-activating domain-containing protein [Paraburkholderia sp.]|jgi:hypothetical protein